MGWSGDWLYSLLLNEARAVWAKVQESAPARGLPVPEYLLAAEHSACAELHPCGEIVRCWTSRDDFASLSDPPTEPTEAVAPGASLFRRPVVAWYLEPDRKQVLICHYLGPLWGRGGWWDVIGQGYRGKLRGRLRPSDNRAGWIS